MISRYCVMFAMFSSLRLFSIGRDLENVLDDLAARGRQDALRMELHAVDGQFLVLDGHDDALELAVTSRQSGSVRAARLWYRPACSGFSMPWKRPFPLWVIREGLPCMGSGAWPTIPPKYCTMT